MAFDDDNYVLDADGNSDLVGLTLDETREFECLDELISGLDPMSPVSTDDGRFAERKPLACAVRNA
jgi:hypothetical protein